MFRHYLAAGLVAIALSHPALAARVKKAVDNTDTVKALVRPGAASRKVETANRAAAIAFWQALGSDGDATLLSSKYLAPGFVNHAPGLPAGGEAFVGALRSRAPTPATKPLFVMSTGELVMLGEGADPKNPQAAFHVSIMRVVDGKISEYWADGS